MTLKLKNPPCSACPQLRLRHAHERLRRRERGDIIYFMFEIKLDEGAEEARAPSSRFCLLPTTTRRFLL